MSQPPLSLLPQHSTLLDLGPNIFLISGDQQCDRDHTWRISSHFIARWAQTFLHRLTNHGIFFMDLTWSKLWGANLSLILPSIFVDEKIFLNGIFYLGRGCQTWVQVVFKLSLGQKLFYLCFLQVVVVNNSASVWTSGYNQIGVHPRSIPSH